MSNADDPLDDLFNPIEPIPVTPEQPVIPPEMFIGPTQLIAPTQFVVHPPTNFTIISAEGTNTNAEDNWDTPATTAGTPVTGADPFGPEPDVKVVEAVEVKEEIPPEPPRPPKLPQKEYMRVKRVVRIADYILGENEMIVFMDGSNGRTTPSDGTG